MFMKKETEKKAIQVECIWYAFIVELSKMATSFNTMNFTSSTFFGLFPFILMKIMSLVQK